MNDERSSGLHRRAWDLIPWLVAGHASPAERHLVEQHASGCADCRDELAFHDSLQAGMRAAPAPTPDPEPALQRMWARIDAADGAAAGEPRSAPSEVGRPPARWTRWLVAALVVQAIGLATLGGRLWERPAPPSYETLTGSAAAPVRAAPSIRLVPAPALRLGELQALLAHAELRVVESSADAAILGVAARPGSAATLAETLLRLRADPGVLLAEPVLDTPAPRR